MNPRCICGGPMCWDSDYCADEVGMGDDDQVASYYHCQLCDSEAVFVSPKPNMTKDKKKKKSKDKSALNDFRKLLDKKRK